jgi:hypothetical protein
MSRLSIVITGLLAAFALAACQPAPANDGKPASAATSRPVPTATLAAPTPTATRVVQATAAPVGTAAPATGGRNPFGIQGGTDSLALDRRVTVAKSLGAAYFRPADVYLDQWHGACADCAAIGQSGLKVVLGIRETSNAATAIKAPADLAAFQRMVNSIFDQYRPEVVFVEHEEARFDQPLAPLPTDYTAELKAVCDVAHSRRIKCATGGLGTSQLVSLVWAQYMDRDSGTACAFARRALDAQAAGSYCAARALAQLETKAQGDVNRGRVFLQAYKDAGADYVGLNWSLADPQALGEAVAYVQAASGLPAVVKEFAAADAAGVAPLDLNLAYAGWIGADAGALRALTNADGSLRATGKAYQDFVQARFK